MRNDRGNRALATLLAEAGLTPRALAREINRWFGAGTLADTAPYHWRDHGGIPREPIPALVVFVLSRRLGRTVSVTDLWPGDNPGGGPVALQPASAGMDGPWTLATTLLVAEDWLLGGVVDRRQFLSVSGAALTGAVSIYLNQHAPAGPALPPVAVNDPLVDQIEASIPQLQLLDDEHGGAAGLGYVGAQVRAVLLLLRDGGHVDAVVRRLLIALADLAQLAGWKAFDAGQHGLAQRYYFTGLRAAHDAGYPAMAAHILADLAFQAASLGDTRDGLRLGEAAERTARATTASVHASVSSRLGYVQAAAGDTVSGHDAWARARDQLTNRRPEHDPQWMYYLTPGHLDCQAGYSMILAGRRAIGAGSAATGRSLLRQGEALLRTGAYARPVDQPYQRRALYEGAWLALGYTAHGKFDQACEVTRLALCRLGRVRSPRSSALLSVLATDLRRRTRNRDVAELLPELDRALAGQR